jgi:hypothetical protein
MERLPIPRKRRPRTKAETARAAVRTALTAIAGWKATKAITKDGGRRVAPVAGAGAVGGALLAVRRRRRKKQEQGLGLHEPPPAPGHGVSPPPDPSMRRPKEAPGEPPEPPPPADG